jgi:hypothetical protein
MWKAVATMVAAVAGGVVAVLGLVKYLGGTL